MLFTERAKFGRSHAIMLLILKIALLLVPKSQPVVLESFHLCVALEEYVDFYYALMKYASGIASPAIFAVELQRWKARYM